MKAPREACNWHKDVEGGNSGHHLKVYLLEAAKMANHEDCFARKRSGSGLPVKRQYHSEELLLIYLLFI